MTSHVADLQLGGIQPSGMSSSAQAPCGVTPHAEEWGRVLPGLGCLVQTLINPAAFTGEDTEVLTGHGFCHLAPEQRPESEFLDLQQGS